MMIERDEAEWPRAPDPVHSVIGELLVVIIENTKDGSEARKTAMTAVLECQRRIVDALRVGPVLN
jgi:hypothetical protein